jgi:Protein of unknown function (DUF3089)
MIDREMGQRRCRGAAARRLAGVLAVGALALLALTGVASAKSSTVWLCKGGGASDPCRENRTATVVTYNGATRTETVQKAIKHGSPGVDCFYVYPTVSEQEGPNANLTIEPQEKQIAIDQASRFSQDCKVYAPMYPQLTLKAINNPGGITEEDELKAYAGVQGAFLEYMRKFNKGRGIVLIGHSQGALMLENLIKQDFDPNPALRKQLVSAILLGGNVLVPEGQLEGGTFQHVPACQSATDTACVIAYSSFLKEPPENADFGRPGSALLEGGAVPPGTQVLCVNPTLLSQNGGTGNLLTYAPTTPFPGTLGAGSPVPSASTPWVEAPGLYTAQCKHENGASWLQVSLRGGLSEEVQSELAARNELAEELIGPEWGLHLYDVNIALGNLVNTVAIQTQAYGFES